MRRSTEIVAVCVLALSGALFLPVTAGGATEEFENLPPDDPARARLAGVALADAGTLAVHVDDLPVEAAHLLNNTTACRVLTSALDGSIEVRPGARAAAPEQPQKPEEPEKKPLAELFPLAAEGEAGSGGNCCGQSEGDVCLAPGRDLRVDLMPPADSSAIMPGTYPGSIVFTHDDEDDDSKDLVLRRQIKLTAGPRPPRPLFDSWTIRFDRLVPFTAGRVGGCPALPRGTSCGRGAWIGLLPIAPSRGEPARPDRPVGHLAEGEHRAAAVHQVGTDAGAVRLELRGVGRFSSSYEGEIDLDPGDDEAGTVELTVEIKDHWLWAVLCIALGIWVAYRLEQFLQVRRGVWLAREREAQLGIDFEAAEKRFLHKAAGAAGDSPPPWAGVSIGRDMDRRRREVRQELAALEGLVLQAVQDDPRFIDVQAELDRLEAAAAGWAGFANELAALAKAATAIRRLSPDPEPACLARAESLLAPAELTLEAVDPPAEEPVSSRYFERRQQVVAATATVDAWLSRRLVDLTKAPLMKFALGRPEAAAPPSAPELADDRERRDYYAGLRRRYEGLTTLVAFALAVIAGIEELYVDSDFTTPWHYLQALSLGAGTKLALDTVLAAIGHLPTLVKAIGRR